MFTRKQNNDDKGPEGSFPPKDNDELTHKGKEIMVSMFKALIRPVLEYSNVVSNPQKKNLKPSFRIQVQKCFTKRIMSMKKREYEQRFKKLKLPSLECRSARDDMNDTFKNDLWILQ